MFLSFIFLFLIGNVLVLSQEISKDAGGDEDLPVRVLVNLAPNEKPTISPSNCKIWGPGLLPHEIVLPARYFYVQLVGPEGER